MVEKLVIPCGNAARGCTALFLGATIKDGCLKAAEHEVSCRFAPLACCPILSCKKTKIEDLKEHLMLEHGMKEDAVSNLERTRRIQGPVNDGDTWGGWGDFK